MDVKLISITCLSFAPPVKWPIICLHVLSMIKTHYNGVAMFVRDSLFSRKCIRSIAIVKACLVGLLSVLKIGDEKCLSENVKTKLALQNKNTKTIQCRKFILMKHPLQVMDETY